MTLVTVSDTVTLLRLVHAVVAADPVGNTMFGSIGFGLQVDDAAGWAAYQSRDPLILVARSQPYTPVTFTSGWTALDQVVDALAGLDPPPAAVAGPATVVEDVAAALGDPVTVRIDERLFRLDELRTPHAVAGSARHADQQDTDFLADWYADFTVEAFGRLPPGFDARKMVEHGVVNSRSTSLCSPDRRSPLTHLFPRSARSRCWIWSDAAGTPVSMAVRHPVMSGAARIGPVYTPPDVRGRGFGSAATSAASRDILDEGAVPCLFTDLANPTSNKIYQAMGYVPVLDRTMLRFD